MSHDKTISTGTRRTTSTRSEHNSLGPITNGAFSSYGETHDRVAVAKDSTRASRVGLRGGRYRHYTLAEKLAARIIKRPNGCWEVQGHALENGYIQISVGSPRQKPYVRVRAHVVAWEQANGCKVPKGLEVMHACDNPRCANPAHLSVGTHRENILDSVCKGRYNCFGIQKLDAAKVQEIRALVADGRLTQKAIGARFGVARNTISGIVNGKTWAHLPFVGEQVAS